MNFLFIFFFSIRSIACYLFFFFNDTATTEIYTLSLHDALPISIKYCAIAIIGFVVVDEIIIMLNHGNDDPAGDRKSTRLNSSHDQISYAVFCLKKKKQLVRIQSVATPITIERERMTKGI